MEKRMAAAILFLLWRKSFHLKIRREINCLLPLNYWGLDKVLLYKRESKTLFVLNFFLCNSFFIPL